MSVIRIEDIAHVRYAAPDLKAMREFLEDFGMAVFEHQGRLYGRRCQSDAKRSPLVRRPRTRAAS